MKRKKAKETKEAKGRNYFYIFVHILVSILNK